MRLFIRYLLCAPVDFFIWPLLFFVRLTSGKRVLFRNGYWIVLKDKPFLFRKWSKEYRGACFGHGGILVDKEPELTLVHELVHVEQFEASMISSFSLALVCLVFTLSILPSILIWSLGYSVFLIGGWLAAFFRKEPLYKGSHHEEAAFHIAEEYLRRKEGDAERRTFK